MSADDPTDDELEAEARRDVPIPSGGTARHSPRLGTVSRAINPRAALEAEAAGQSRDAFDMRAFPDLAQLAQRQQDRAVRQQAEQAATFRAAAQSIRATGGLRSLQGPGEEECRTSQREMGELAWDDYAAAALGALLRILPSNTAEELAGEAAQLADRLLEERRRRFG